jgi:hypothetical protein
MKDTLKARKMTSVMQAGEQTVDEGTKGKWVIMGISHQPEP